MTSIRPPAEQQRSGARRRRIGTGVRIAAFAGVTVLLTGLALVAGGVGPWTARPLGSAPAPAPAREMTRSLVQQSSVDRPPQDSTPAALGWGVRLLLIALAALVLALLLRWIFGKLRRLRRDRLRLAVLDERSPGWGGVPGPPAVRDRESGRDFDPRAAADAIISCWLWVEGAAAAAGAGRQDQDTPTEFLQRVVDLAADDRSGPADDDRPGPAERVRPAAATLLPLYQRARFDQQALTADAAIRAREAAETLCMAVGIGQSSEPGGGR